MKHLVKHLWLNNKQEIIDRSLLHCHCYGLHSVMLLESPGKTIRLFIADIDNDLQKNFPSKFINKDMSVAFHPHHCNVTLHCIKGSLYNWTVVENHQGFIPVRKFMYHSKINEGELSFSDLGVAQVETLSHNWINVGEAAVMKANEIHTVACYPGIISAWFVYEGLEDPHYESFCWSNQNLLEQDFSQLYKKPDELNIELLLSKCGLL